MLAVAVFGATGSGCPRGGARHPSGPRLAPWDARVETAGPAGLPGVAIAEDGRVFASFQADLAATLEGTELAPPTGGSGVVATSARGKPAWARVFAGVRTGAVAVAGDLVAVAIAGEGRAELGGGVALRGAPGAAIVGLAVADGADRWVRPIGATGWVIVRGLAALPGGDLAAAGSFAGTLRAGDAVVTAAGPSDGFAARLGPDGAVRWLIRIGGEATDAIAAVAATPDGVVVGGTFTSSADARGISLEAVDPESIFPDGFVARLGDDGTVQWAQPFGGSADDSVAGVGVTATGVIGVAATLRGDVIVDGKAISARGLADAALLTFDGTGGRRAVALIGGAEPDSAAGLAAMGEVFVVAASYAGQVVVGDAHLDASGGNGAVIAVLDSSGDVIRVHDVAGDGRETVASIAAAPGGWVAAIRHTAGSRVDDSTFQAPADPYGGAALIVRGE